jgi:DNA-directed RNA polymerase specialized sigma24 family protein
MITNAPATNTGETFDLSSDITFRKLYPSLELLAKYFVYTLHVSSWQGQEEDIVADIVQETWRRIIERSRKAERGEAPPIRSLKSIMAVIARNYCKDLGRHDRRLLRIQYPDASQQTYLPMCDQQNLLESGTESVYQEALFKLVAREIVRFPEKQRIAVLTDLANRMCFEKQLTPLQIAFLKEGIDLRDYQKPLPTDPQERSRHVSLVTYAYKRVANLKDVQKYIAFA